MTRGLCSLQQAQQPDSRMRVHHLCDRERFFTTSAAGINLSSYYRLMSGKSKLLMLALARPVTRYRRADVHRTRHQAVHNVTSSGWRRSRATLLPFLPLASERAFSASHDLTNSRCNFHLHPHTKICARPTSLFKWLPLTQEPPDETDFPLSRCETCTVHD
jgi:hypothetical protein